MEREKKKETKEEKKSCKSSVELGQLDGVLFTETEDRRGVALWEKTWVSILDMSSLKCLRDV